MSDNQAIVRYNFKLRPGSAAEARLIMEWDLARYVWNRCVEAGNVSLQKFNDGEEYEIPTFCRMSKQLTLWRAELEWLRKGSQMVQQQTIRKWSEERQRAFSVKGKRQPKFKSSKISRPSLEYTRKGFKVGAQGIRIIGGVTIPVVWSRELPSTPKSCTISRDGTGCWNVSFVVRRDNETFPDSNAAIGIDWGVSQVATTTSPSFDLPCGNQTINSAKVLKEAQRRLARAKSGSKKREKAKKRVAVIHLRIARQRKDRAFKWARKVVTAFGRIAVEDLKPIFLAKTTMAKKATDGAIGITKQILTTMAGNARRNIVLVNPAFTTMECSHCGTIAKARIALNIRTFSCHSCGFTAGRDENAASVMLVRAGFNPTNVDGVRLRHDSGRAVAV